MLTSKNFHKRLSAIAVQMNGIIGVENFEIHPKISKILENHLKKSKNLNFFTTFKDFWLHNLIPYSFTSSNIHVFL
jgi:hypothetical protein